MLFRKDKKISLENQIKKTLRPGMYIPKELSLLFDWIEDHKYYIDYGGRRIGALCSQSVLNEQLDSEERHGGTIIEFSAEGNESLKCWFAHEKSEVLNRLCVFAKTGGDGSMAAFWIDEQGKQKIVHLGSGSGSVLLCVLAENPIDFIRLIAIGYDEICWNDYFDEVPNASMDVGDVYVHPNVEFQNWVKSTFNVTIPQKANQIVPYPSEMDDNHSQDEFWRWVNVNT